MTRRTAPLLLSGVVLACGGSGERTPTTVQAPTVAAITVTESSATIPVGASVRLTATPRDAAGQPLADVALAWSSSDTLVAPVSEGGEVLALAPGSATVTASAQGQQANAEVTVLAPTPAGPVAASIAVTPSTVTVSVGRSAQLTAVVRDSAGSALAGYAPTWTSSNDEVASVGPTGDLFGRGAGTAVVTAALGDLRATAQVTVPLEAAQLELMPASAAITLGGRLQLLGRFADRLGQSIPGQVTGWTSSDPDRLSVSATGEVRALASAAGTITASGEGVSGAALVIVREAMPFDSISVGGYHGCGLADGTAHCWGSGYDGQLGNGAAGNEAARTAPVAVVGGLRFTSISADIATCGTVVGGEAYCWGPRPGDPYDTPEAVRTPERVGGAMVWSQITAGQAHVCGVSTGGGAYCWGNNDSGQLGDGTLDVRALPTAVFGGLAFTWLDASFGHTCGLTSGNEVFCWGMNYGGALGNGVSEYGMSPTPLPVVRP